MAKGSFAGLYTFEDIAKIYKMDSSNLRKMVQKEKFLIGKDIKKFGKTWLITEDAIDRFFGLGMLHLHTEELTIAMLNKKKEEKKIKALEKKEKKNKKNDVMSFDAGVDDDGDVEELKEIIVDEKNVVHTFNF
ncbi:hypothetical protein [Cetobacterium sp.]|uniref:hypothetical protein n=1 Tax=Cetobacterium sp. TaxID=2071632 RepID=UPI003F33C679